MESLILPVHGSSSRSLQLGRGGPAGDPACSKSFQNFDMSFFSNDADRPIEALGRSLAVIEFTPSDQILSANENFCSILGYAPADLVGRHHRIFVEPALAAATEYEVFWQKLAKGAVVSDAFEQLGEGGLEIWIRAT